MEMETAIPAISSNKLASIINDPVKEKDLSRKGLTKEKVLALIISLMERTSIRVGNSMYEKMYGSFGLTTLKDKHTNIKGNSVNFSFKGKKGYYVHPEIISQYESGAIQNYFDQLDAIEENDGKTGLTKEEKIVLSILEKKK